MKNYLFLLIYVSSLFGAVEESVIPQMASIYEQADARKYSTRQYLEIREKLAKKGEAIRVVTFNTLFDFYDNDLPEAYRWPQRKARVAEMIEHLQPDILGVQELCTNQLKDLLPCLEGKYAYFGVPQKNGEINAIFYNKHRFELIETRYMDPMNFVKLQDRATGKAVAFCNTHLAFSNIDKREAQAEKIHRFISEFLREETTEVPPLILTGDMNTFPNLPSLKKLPFLDGTRIESLLKGDLLVDARECALLGHVGPLSTFSNNGEDTTPFQGSGTPGVFLDHIFVTKDITVLMHAVEPGRVDGLYPSDHLPVIADIQVAQ